MTNAPSKSFLTNRSIPALVAVGSGLAAFPASALELGDITVQSRLGQPLRASIAYALAPNEQISNHCVTMRPGASVSGLPGIGNAAVSITNGVILLAGNTPVREPMVSAHVVVNCPYSANLSREYMLFIDPLSAVYEAPTVTQQASPIAPPVAVEPSAVSQPVPSVATQNVARDISASTTYPVQAGDTLSDIASRIENRPLGLWPAVNAIFAANPDAFINNDPNRLKAGSTLLIPDFGGNAAVIEDSAATTTAINTAAVTALPVAADLDNGATDSALAAYDPNATPSANAAVTDSATQAIILDDLTNAEVSATTSTAPTEIILDEIIAGPTTASSSPNVPVATISPRTGTEGVSRSWIYWLAGSGIALFLGLLFFGRRFRGDSYTAPSESLAPQHYGRRTSDAESTDTESIETIGVDYDLSDDSPTEENLALDADLIIGTGLAEGTSDAALEDFEFAASDEVASVSDETDMLPSLHTDEHTILESEVLPVDDDYDMSVIVDATKMPQPEDATERDLKAVKIEADDDTLVAQNYTINKEVDFQVLEQDYEDEFTATQALNGEIARAAAELAERIDGTESSDEDDLTAALPLASVTELDVTAQMPAQNDDVTDAEETVNEDMTVSMEPDDETVEMPVESGKAS